MTTAKNDSFIGFGLQLENFHLVGGARGTDFLVGKNKNLVGGGNFSM